MRALMTTLVVCLSLGACATDGNPASPDASKDIEVLKKRITKLENRLQNLEGRLNRSGGTKAPTAGAKGGKATPQPAPTKGGKAPAQGAASTKAGKAPAGKDAAAGSTRSAAGRAGASAKDQTPQPTVQVKVEGDAKQVMVSRGDRKMRLPARLPAGKYNILAAFGDKPLQKKLTLEVQRGTPVTVVCASADETCTVQ